MSDFSDFSFRGSREELSPEPTSSPPVSGGKRKERVEDVQKKVLKASESSQGPTLSKRQVKQRQRLEEALLHRSEKEVAKILKKGHVEPTFGMIRQVLTARNVPIAARLIEEMKTDFTPQEWQALFQLGCQVQEPRLLMALVAKMPQGDEGCLKAFFDGYEFSLQQKLEALSSALLRASVVLLPVITAHLIDATPAETLARPDFRDIVLGSMKRSSPEIVAALARKNIRLPERSEARLAAEKGDALQAATSLMQSQQAGSKPLRAKVAKSAQKVLLMPEKGIVMKKSMPKAEEDENLVTGLFNIAKAGGVLPYVRLKDLAPKRFGLAAEHYEWSFQLRDFSADRMKNVADRLPQKEAEKFLKTIIKRQVSPEAIAGRAEFRKLHLLTWKILTGAGWQTIPFNHLADMILNEKIAPQMELEVAGKKVTLEQLHLTEPDFQKALQYRREIVRSEEHYLVPDTQGMQEEYAKWGNTSWMVRYQDPTGNVVERELTFKELQKLYLEGRLDATFAIRELNGEQFFSLDANPDFWKALTVPWKVASHYSPVTEVEKVSLTDVQAKRFMQGMKTVEEMSPEFRQKAFARLDQNSEMNAILLSELQFYDLHTNNLGVRVKRNEANAAFIEASFTVPRLNKTVRFDELVELYLTGIINDNDRVNFEKKAAPLRMIADLRAALQNPSYELVLFDIDVNFAETNGVHYLETGTQGFLLPLRSCLLKLEWKDKALAPEVVEWAKQAEKRDLASLQWISGATSPIYHFIGNELKEAVLHKIFEFAKDPKYSLSYYGNRAEKPQTTVAEIREVFSDDLSQLDTKEKIVFWNTLQTTLISNGWFRPYVVQPGESWQEIAIKLDSNLAELRRLNPDVKQLTPGMALNTKPNLLDPSPFAQSVRQKLSAQLFPKATVYQIEAFRERIALRNQYFASVQKLDLMLNQRIYDITELRQILQQRSTPLATVAKTNYLEDLQAIELGLFGEDQARELQRLTREIANEIKPTYFNLTKALYPLLADVWEVLLVRFGSPVEAGSYVGQFGYSIEKLIADVEIYAKKASNPAIREKVEALKEAFEKEKERSQIRDRYLKNGQFACY